MTRTFTVIGLVLLFANGFVFGLAVGLKWATVIIKRAFNEKADS